MKKSLAITVLIVAILLIVWSTTFLLVVQPIGAVPKGRTVWIFKPDRLFTQEVIPFVCSADGMLLKTTGSVNLFGRAIMLAALSESGNIIGHFPYSHTLYLISTGGAKFNQ